MIVFVNTCEYSYEVVRLKSFVLLLQRRSATSVHLWLLELAQVKLIVYLEIIQLGAEKAPSRCREWIAEQRIAHIMAYHAIIANTIFHAINCALLMEAIGLFAIQVCADLDCSGWQRQLRHGNITPFTQIAFPSKLVGQRALMRTTGPE
jgi:hypothetical protein